jgi:ATP-dependent Clp protease ATP-binding subunit ClpA
MTFGTLDDHCRGNWHLHFCRHYPCSTFEGLHSHVFSVLATFRENQHIPIIGEENHAAMKATVMEVVGYHFRPEFINRVDNVVVFHPLGRDQILGITDIQIRYLRKCLPDHDIDPELSEAPLDKLGEANFGPAYGARPLKQAMRY